MMRRVRLVRGEGCGVSDEYEGRGGGHMKLLVDAPEVRIEEPDFVPLARRRPRAWVRRAAR